MLYPRLTRLVPNFASVLCLCVLYLMFINVVPWHNIVVHGVYINYTEVNSCSVLIHCNLKAYNG